jgi:hypothetical protein
VQRRLRRADDQHEVGFEQRAVDAKRRGGRSVTQVDELLVLDVVHRHVAVEPAREVGLDEGPEVPVAEPAREPAGDEQRLVAGRDPEPFELVHG